MPSPLWCRLVVAAVAPGAALGLTGCAKTVRASDVESKITKNLQGQLPGRTISVDCPEGRKAKKGTTFTCRVKIDKEAATADVRLTTTTGFSFQIHSAGAAGG